MLAREEELRMSQWTFLENTKLGSCLTKLNYHQFTKVMNGFGLFAALDEFGRLFIWGSVRFGFPPGKEVLGAAVETFEVNPIATTDSNDSVAIPLQIGQDQTWVDVDIGEYSIIALNNQGEAYIIGHGGEGKAGTGVTDYENLFDYSTITTRYTKNGGENGLLKLTKIENTSEILWDKVISNSIHSLGMSDGKVYVWGTNFNNEVWGTETEFAEDEVVLNATEMTWLPIDTGAKVIDIATDLLGPSAVATDSGQVLVFGEFSDQTYFSEAYEIPGLPSNAEIVSLSVSFCGTTVVLSDGTAWGHGFYNNQTVGFGWRDDFTKLEELPGRKFIKTDSENCTAGFLDSRGNLWGMGSSDGFLSRNDIDCFMSSSANGGWNTLLLVAASHVGQFSYIDFSMLTSGLGGSAVDINGQLITWGDNFTGSLGADLNDAELDDSCTPMAAASALGWRGRNHNSFYGFFPGQGNVEDQKITIRDAEQLVFLNTERAVGYSEFTPVEDELEPNHEPHWHKQLFDEIIPADCWFPVVAIDGTDVLYVGCGWSHYNFIMLRFRMINRSWEILYLRKPLGTLRTSEVDGGASIKVPVFAFHNWKDEVIGFTSPRALDAGGFPIEPTFDDSEFATWVIDQSGSNTILNYIEWPGTHKMNGRGKVAVNDGGVVAVIIEDDDFWTVEVSVNYGFNYSTKKSYPYDVDITDSGIFIDSENDIYIVRYDVGASSFTVERSTNNGDTWALQASVGGTIVGATGLEFSIDSSEFFITLESTSGVEFYYSVNKGVTWTKRDFITEKRFFIASGTQVYALNNGIDKYTLDYTESTIDWEDGAGVVVPARGKAFNTSSVKAYIKNSGQNAVYVSPNNASSIS